jgi:CheY-like chemotaxis protein
MATERPATQAKRILVVEIRMLLEDMLGELGYTVAAEAARIEEALVATKNADFDLAILDADLNGQPASPVACCPSYPRYAVRLCHGLWQRARALSGPADADEAVSDRWAQANATERARVAVAVSSSAWGIPGEGKGRREAASLRLLLF